MKKDVFNLSIVVLMMIGTSALAQDTIRQDSTKKLNEVTVTATRSEKNIFDVGRTVNIVPNSELKNGQYNNLADVLSQQEGIYMVGTGQNFGGTQSLFIRGAASNQSVIMIDGVRITDPSAVNNSPDLSEFTLTNIDKIEVVQGSHSTMYGSSAIGGVVNMMTKKNMDPGFHVDAMAMGGVYGKGAAVNGQNVFLDYTFKKGFYINGEINNFSSSGQNATVDTITNPHTYDHPDKDGFAKMDYVAKAGYHTEKADAYFSYRHTDMITQIDNGAYSDDDNYVLNFKRDLLTYGASYKFNEHLSLSFIGGYSAMQRKSKNDSSLIDTVGHYDGKYYDATNKGANATNELQLNWKVKGFDLVFGGGMYAESMSQQYFSYSHSIYGTYIYNSNLDSLHLKTNTTNVFAHADISGVLISEKLKNLSLGLGTRYSDHSVFGSHSTFEINPSYKITESSMLYASYSSGFNAPSLYNMYAPDQYSTNGITLGNPDLKPETSLSFEVGYKQKLSENTSFTAAVFTTEIKNMIEYINLWNPNVAVDSLSYLDARGSTYINIGTTTTKGVELGMKSKLNEKFYFSANICLVSGKLEYDPALIDTAHTHGNRIQLSNSGAFLQNQKVEVIGLTRRPSTSNVSLTWKPIKSLMLRTDVRYVGQRYDIYYASNLGPYGANATTAVGDYMLVDFSAKYNFTKNISAGLKCENIFDVKYYEINGYTTRGRGVYINLRVSF